MRPLHIIWLYFVLISSSIFLTRILMRAFFNFLFLVKAFKILPYGFNMSQILFYHSVFFGNTLNIFSKSVTSTLRTKFVFTFCKHFGVVRSEEQSSLAYSKFGVSFSSEFYVKVISYSSLLESESLPVFFTAVKGISSESDWRSFPGIAETELG